MAQLRIYGIPGVGKSTLAQKLAVRLRYDYIELDTIRHIAQSQATRAQSPFLYEYTTEAWKEFGPLNAQTAIQGLLAVRSALKPYIDEALSEVPPNVIAEATFLEPKMPAVLITCRNEKMHNKCYYAIREHTELRDLRFTVSRSIQDYLIADAQDKGIPALDNDAEIDEVLARLVGIVAKLVR